MKVLEGSLAAVGVGIRAPSQTTLEVTSEIKRADKVYSLLYDPLAEYWVRSLNGNTTSLGYLYAVGKLRQETYDEMVEQIVGSVRQGLRVCAASYGHPAVFAYPLRESVRCARAEGFQAEMLPGVSAEDCLFAELGVDPAVSGCHSYEATDFLIYRRGIDPSSNLLLWQIGAVGVSGFKEEAGVWNPDGLAVLVETLLEVYSRTHEVVVYEAALLPVCTSIVERVELANVPNARVTPMSTLYIPPMIRSTVDEAMVRRLKIDGNTTVRRAHNRPN